MENLIISQSRESMVNLRNVFCIEIRKSKNVPGLYNLIAYGLPNDTVVTLGSYSTKEMAQDIKRDIAMWNSINDSLKTEYMVPQDNPDYSSTVNAADLFGANLLKNNSQTNT